MIYAVLLNLDLDLLAIDLKTLRPCLLPSAIQHLNTKFEICVENKLKNRTRFSWVNITMTLTFEEMISKFKGVHYSENTHLKKITVCVETIFKMYTTLKNSRQTKWLTKQLLQSMQFLNDMKVYIFKVTKD